jgi:hypothetical protein
MPTTATVTVKSFDQPEEVRPFAGHGHSDFVEIGGRPVGRGIFEPGWRWSQDLKPIAGTDSCQVHHMGYCIQGHMRVTMDDGSVQEIGPGQVADIPPGHDAEVVGDEACMFLDWGEISGYAKR